MMTATLGGLIKDYRIKKRLSQVDISLKIGWKDTSRISKIEQGRVGKPNRQTIEKIIKALELSPQEKSHFLLVGGYIPSDEEVQKIIKEVKHRVDTWTYPAFLMDFSYRWLYINNAEIKALNIPNNKKTWIEQKKPNLLSVAFMPESLLEKEHMMGESEEDITIYKASLIEIFKSENEQYQSEPWYKKLIKELMVYKEFRDLWQKSNEKLYRKKFFNYEYETFAGNYQGKELDLRFHCITTNVVSDPRFQVILYFPANKETEAFFIK